MTSLGVDNWKRTCECHRRSLQDERSGVSDHSGRRSISFDEAVLFYSRVPISQAASSKTKAVARGGLMSSTRKEAIPKFQVGRKSVGDMRGRGQNGMLWLEKMIRARG